MSNTSLKSPSSQILDVAKRNIGKAKIRTNTESMPCQLRTLEIKAEIFPEKNLKPITFKSGIRDIQPLMLVPLFSLSKNLNFRASIKTFHVAGDCYIRVLPGPAGMPTIWDYDLMLVVISQITHQLNELEAIRGPKPSQSMLMKTSDILNFCRRGTGGSQRDRLEPALKRLKETQIQFIYKNHSGTTVRENSPEHLIKDFDIITAHTQLIEIKIPAWLIKMVARPTKKLTVLKMHDEYFDLTATERFLYRFVRRAAGDRKWEWGFDKIYQRSGSTSTRGKFYELLRRVIALNRLPEYDIAERSGKVCPVLVMKKRVASRLNNIDLAALT